MATVVVDEAGMHVARTIRALRRKRDMTLGQVSEKMDTLGRPMDLSTVARVEKGHRRVDVDDLAAFATILEVSPAELLGVPNVPQPKRASTRARIEVMPLSEARNRLVAVLDMLEL